MTTLQRLALLGRELMAGSRLSSAAPQLSSLRAFESGTISTTALPQWTEVFGLQRIVSLLPSLTDMQLLAAPKRKVTPHRKGKRSANKHIRFIPVVSQCSQCGRVFPPHGMPAKCEEDACPAFNLRERPSRARPAQAEARAEADAEQSS